MTADERPDYVHRLLEDAGETWRSQQKQTSAVDVRWFRDAPRVQSPLFAGLAAAGIVVLAVTAVLLSPRISEPALLPGGSIVAIGPTAEPSTPTGSTAPPSPTPIHPDRPTPSPSGTDEIVREGDFVTVSGYVIERIDGQPAVCEQLISIGMVGAPPFCMDPAVRVQLQRDIRNLPGAAEVGGTWASGYLIVEGTWEGDHIRVTDAIPTERPVSSSQDRAVPCEAPAGGWPVVDTTDLDFEAAGVAAEEKVGADPDRYAGLWAAFVVADSGTEGNRAVVYVVATTDDVDSVTTELREVWPYNLCVVPVPFSAKALEGVRADLAANGRPWSLETNLGNGGITLRTTVLDDFVAAALGSGISQYTVEPLVRKLGDEPSSAPTDEIVREGDLVTMAGRILELDDGPVICADVIYAGRFFGCGGPAMLSLTGLDARSVPGSYNEYSQGWITQTVTVVGHWRAKAIDVTGWTLGGQPIDLYGSRAAPCDSPEGGWAPGSGSERAGRALDREVKRHPDRYGGYWGVWEGTTYIAVIAATDDVDDATARLEGIFSHNLCVTHVSISEAEVERVAADLGYRESAFAMELNATEVVLYVPVVDVSTLEAFSNIEGLSLRGFAAKVPE